MSTHSLAPYLARHAEPEASAVALAAAVAMRQVLTVVAHDEPASEFELLDTLPAYRGDAGTLVILLVNDRDDASVAAVERGRAFHAALIARYGTGRSAGGGATEHTAPFGTLLVLRRTADTGPLPAKQGVGLARKIACDVALSLAARGQLHAELIHCTDADARLPPDYFGRVPARDGAPFAAVYPFEHAGHEAALRRAGTEYEIWLRYYVLGLQRAGSPYAMHTVGSTIAVSMSAYAAVRGFPRRHGAEDFYLLNKLAKVGPVLRLGGAPITLRDRASDRIPFGTGPAVRRIVAGQPSEFHNPRSFELLGDFLIGMHRLATDSSSGEDPAALAALLCPRLVQDVALRVVRACGIDVAVRASAARRNAAARLRHLHTYFDAFQTLKWIRRMHGPQGLLGLQTLPAAQAVAGLLGGASGDLEVDLERLRALEHSECRGDIGPTCGTFAAPSSAPARPGRLHM